MKMYRCATKFCKGAANFRQNLPKISTLQNSRVTHANVECCFHIKNFNHFSHTLIPCLQKRNASTVGCLYFRIDSVWSIQKCWWPWLGVHSSSRPSFDATNKNPSWNFFHPLGSNSRSNIKFLSTPRVCCYLISMPGMQPDPAASQSLLTESQLTGVSFSLWTNLNEWLILGIDTSPALLNDMIFFKMFQNSVMFSQSAWRFLHSEVTTLNSQFREHELGREPVRSDK